MSQGYAGAVRVDLLTREFPPEVYGGAGVHVAELAAHLQSLVDLTVRCFGADRRTAGVHAYEVDPHLAAANAALGVAGVDLAMAADCAGADVVHSHTWYANLAGHVASLLHGIPHVATTHSLEPRRPWKAEQLAGGYRLSSWCERTALEAADALIAVSAGMRADVLECYPTIDPSKVHVIYNGIDTERFHQVDGRDALVARGIDPSRPLVLFVGRITRQKGLTHLLSAAALLADDVQLLVCGSAPDTPELGAEIDAQIAQLATRRDGVHVTATAVPGPELIALLSAADVFCCPSVYEPMGIVNLEAMACHTPVVATATGGIPEVVDDGVTGLLVPPGATDATGEPSDPHDFARRLADALDSVLRDRARARAMGEAGRRRAVEAFAWPAIARKTADLYATLI